MKRWFTDEQAPVFSVKTQASSATESHRVEIRGRLGEYRVARVILKTVVLVTINLHCCIIFSPRELSYTKHRAAV